MEFNYKDIFIGQLIEKRVNELNIPLERICKFLKLSESDVIKIFFEKAIDTDLLLKVSKLLEYDFFRIYSHHIILYAPPANINYKNNSKNSVRLPSFNKSLYTPQLIEFIVELVETGEKRAFEIIKEYRIPKTTLYKWLKKHRKE